ncbi:MAG TPA: MFS transporter [Trueperaceae bacterium]|nr:MFS transporter [Trueperaceae bacterium]
MQGTNLSTFTADTRGLTIGIVLGVTLFAFEALAVVTVAPLFVEDLGGLSLYGWVFSGFLLASLLGAVASGLMADSGSLARPLLWGLGFFGVGLAVSGSAPTMLVLIAGRVLQGLGGGALSTVMYAAISRAYPDAARARMMALTSSAWVVPALLGPTLAALVAETLHWRYVFWGILPLLLIVVVLTYRAFSRLVQRAATPRARGRLVSALWLAAGAGLLLTGVGADSWWLAVLALPGIVMVVMGLRDLLPAGTLGLRRGLPSVIAGRGTLFSAFVGVEAFLALLLTSVHGYSTAVTGAVIATGSISWAVGAWLQSRLDNGLATDRARRMFVGTALIALGVVAQVVALFMTGAVLVVVVIGWVLAGLGIGMAHSTSSVLAFALAPTGEDGRVSTALQIADQFTAAVSTGVGGALLAIATRLAWSQQQGILLAIGFVMALAVIGLVATWRSAPVEGAPERVTEAVTPV